MEAIAPGAVALGLGLLLSHLVADFLLQPGSWVAAKNERGLRAWQLWAHATLAGLLAAVVLWGRGGLIPPVLIAASHLAIDWLKTRCAPESVVGLAFDQLAHLAVLGAAWLWVSPTAWEATSTTLDEAALPRLLVMACALVLATSVGGIVIGKATRTWRQEIRETDLGGGLERAGMWIGILERTLILIFVLVSSWQAVGFLITAKTILRFKEIQGADERKIAEYILIGTLISFLWAIAVGLMTVRALGRLA